MLHPPVIELRIGSVGRLAADDAKGAPRCYEEPTNMGVTYLSYGAPPEHGNEQTTASSRADRRARRVSLYRAVYKSQGIITSTPTWWCTSNPKERRAQNV